MDRLENYFSGWVIKYRAWIIAVSLMVLIATGNGLQYLGFDNDYRAFFTDDNPELLAYDEVENTYTKSDNVFILIEPKTGDVFQPEVLKLIEELTTSAWQTPYSRRVDSLQNFQNTYAEDDDLVVESLYEDATNLVAVDIENVKQVGLSDPLLLKRLVSADGRVTALNITIEYPKVDADKELKAVVSKTREMVSHYQKAYPNVNFYITGIAFLNNAFVEAGENDLSLLVPVSLLLMLVIMFVLLRSISAVIGITLIIIFSDVIALGLGGYAGVKLTPASISSAQMIMVLAVANSVHLLVSFMYGLQHKVAKQEALRESIRINLQPIFLTSATTMIGFLCMNFSESPPFHDLGNLVAAGVFVSFCLSLTFLPAIMSYLPVRVKVGEDISVERLAFFSTFVIRHKNFILFSSLVVILASAYAATLNKPEEQFLKYFDKSVEFRVDSDFANQSVGGLFQLSFSLPAEGKGGISDPEYLESLDRFAQWLKVQPEIINTYVLSDTLRRLNKNMHGDDPAWYKLPESRELAAQYLLLYEMSLPYGLDLNNQVNIDKSATLLVVGVQEMSNVELLDFEQRVQQWMQSNLPESMQTNGSGAMLIFAHLTEKNIKSMLSGSVLALVLISMILIFALRSIKIGLLSLVPNLVPVIIGFGLWGLLYVEVNMALASVVSMTLGIVVDDTVHFLSKYLRAKREKGYSTEESITYAFTHVGKALTISTLILSAGFGVLMMSPFSLNSDMATLTTWIIMIALVVDLLLLPILLLKLDKEKQ
ncbi:MAG: efflux RND transporter permease subunit [Cycloclasticus sp.]|jgi:predicted RND superfamily exporter protein|nr:efflux RND transporter permease subunit [Cycloclasticus sp.]